MNTHRKTLTTSDGVQLSYTDHGDGQPVVLVHGMLCHGGHWKFQHQALLDAGYRVITPDLRSHGQSDRPEHGQHVHRLGQDLAELIGATDLQDTILVGHSMGFSVALAYVSLHGTQSTAMIVGIDQSPWIMNDETWQWGVRHVSWEDLPAQLTGRKGWSEPDREPAPSPDVLQMLQEVGGIDDFFTSPLALRYDHFTSDWRDIIPRVDVPLWIATGAHSPSFPLEGMRWVADTAPQGRLTVYPHSGHCPQWNEHEDFNRDLLAFLASSTSP